MVVTMAAASVSGDSKGGLDGPWPPSFWLAPPQFFLDFPFSSFG